MKKLIFNTLFLLFVNTAFAGYGFFGDCASFVEVNSTYYKVSNCSSSGDPNFGGANLGTVTTLNLGELQAFTYQNGGDNVMNTKLYYRIYTGSPSGTFTEINLVNYDPTDLGGGAENRRWYVNPNLNLLSGLTPTQTYSLEIYIQSEVDWNVVDGTKDTDIYINNGGANYSMSFTVDASVPVELTDFTAKINLKEIILNWTTSSEENNTGFEIQKSTNGKDFEGIGFVAGNGNSLETIKYQFIDETPNLGENYYRLKQIDFDGNFEFTDIVFVHFEKEIKVNIFPNPTSENVTIQGDLPTNSQIELINIKGQIIYQQSNFTNEQLKIDLSDFPNGVYLLKISKEKDVIVSQKIIKN